jgi:release factor glutamine methyltransferase
LGAGPANEEPNLLCIAALQPVKNISLVLEAVRGLESRRWHLTIAGIGPMESVLRRRITQSDLDRFVSLAGWQPSDVFKRQLGSYDLLISLSAHEAQGMAMIEAAAAGLPILATRVGVAGELADLGAAIVFVDKPESALAGLQLCLRDLEQLQQKGRAAAANICARYDLAVTVCKFEEIYQRLVAKRTATWHQTRMPLRMKLLRRIRPVVFRIVRPLLQYQRKLNRVTAVDGVKLRTHVDVFHPRYFFSSRILAGYLAECIAVNQRVLDMGTGSGVVGIMAAKRGARVLAVDINPAAVTLANENANQQNLNGCWRCVESDLFAAVDGSEKFEWIAFNPPFFAGAIPHPAAAAWYAGDNHATIDRFLAQARRFLERNGRIVMIVSSDMPLASLDVRFRRYGYAVVAHQPKPHIFEIFHLVQLQASEAV